MRKTIVFCCLLFAGCASGTPGAAPITNNLRPYQAPTASATAPEPAGLILSFQTPLPSATPFTYMVKAGDTLSQLAQKFNVSLDGLVAANPNVNPNAMSVGQVLKIPSQQNPAGAATPTPVPVSVKQIACHPTLDGGMWCFVLVHNDSAGLMEDISAQITLIDSGGKPLAGQTATPPLDILSPNSSLPLIAFFAPNIPSDARPLVQILTAIRSQSNDARYLQARLQNISVHVDSSGLFAQVGGQVNLPSASKPAKLIWVAAVAYDAAGEVAGVRRWESTAGIPAGGSLPFTFMVSSLAGQISHVELAVEGRP
jgi:LysM repeat protein